MNNQILIRLMLALSLMACSFAEASVNLGFVTTNQTASRLDMALMVSGLGDAIAPALSTYDLDISFDPHHLTFVGAQFGDHLLGNQLDVFNLGNNATAAELTDVGLLNVFELTLDSPEDLNGWQADSFTLATLSFNVLNSGSSQLNISINVFDDADAISIPVATNSTTITTVPLPATAWMMLGGLTIFYRRRHRVSSMICLRFC